MRDYELMYIIKPEVTDEDVPKVTEKVAKLITSKGGTITDSNQWGRKKLAYRIDKYAEGNYVVTHFKIEPNFVKELEGNLKLADEVIRHLMVRQDEVKSRVQTPVQPPVSQ